MFEKEFKKYQALNQLAALNGTVIFGSHEDSVIPLGELKQAFNLETNLYTFALYLQWCCLKPPLKANIPDVPL